MNEDTPKNWEKSVEHPSEDDLLSFIDGELSPKLAESLRFHLEACWHCRSRAEKFQSAILLYIDYRTQVMQPNTEVPDGWRGFRSKLQKNLSDMPSPTLWERWSAMLNRFRLAIPSVDPRTARLATISLITIILGFTGIYFLLISTHNIVSAEELINLASVSRENELRSANQPVLYQQIHVKRSSSQGESVLNAEVWQDVDNLRIRKVIVPQPEDRNAAVLVDLEQILRSNNYEPTPLSVVSFKVWRDALTDKHDSVEELKTDDGTPVLRLYTEATVPSATGRILSSSLVIRISDYHPLQQQFRVATTDGEQEYEVLETSFAVMSLNSLSPAFFADSTPMVVSAQPSPSQATSSPELLPSPLSQKSASEPEATTPPYAIAGPDLEVEVLNLLHGARADLGEQIEVRRMPNGPVIVSGVVDTPERKKQLVDALRTVRDNPAVQIRIATAAEALAEQNQAKVLPQPSVQSLQVESDTFPAQADLLAYFKDETAARVFASRMTARSSRAMNYLWAMKRLKSQFLLSELQKLSPESRTKWLNVIRSYARSYQSEISELKKELRPVVGVSAPAGEEVKIDNDTALLQAIDQLFANGSGGNQVIRASFTASVSGANALKTPQFWRMLNQAEALAASIERVH